jgi:MFS transporter, DHA1 family, inner membrane transport protein
VTSRVENSPSLSPPPFPAAALWSLSLSYFVVGTSSLSVVGLVNPMVRGLGVEVPLIAVLVTVFALTFAVATLAGQILLGNMAPKRLMMTGFIVLAFGTLLGASAQSYWVMVVSRMIMASGAAVIGPIASAVGGNLVAVENRGQALAIVFAGMTIASVAGVPLTNFIGDTFGWRQALIIIAVAGLIAAAMIWRIVPDVAPRPAPHFSDIVGLFKIPAVTWALLAALLTMACQFVTYALITPVLVQRYGFQMEYVPLGLFAYGVGGVIGNAVSGKLSDRLGAGRVTTGCLGAMVVLLLIIWMMPPWPLAVIAVMTVWSAMALAFFAPNQMHLVAHAGPAVGLVLALNASALYVGMSLGGALSALLYQISGPGILPLGSAIVVAAALFCYRKALRTLP